MVGLKVQASSLIEVLVAMFILSLSLMIGSMIYMNVLRSSASTQKIEARLYLENLALQLEQDQKFVNQQITTDYFDIDIIFQPYQGSSELLEMKLSAINKENKPLLHLKKIVLVP
ncbi:MAG: hypothetical protein GY827_00200 [Cytophagales bacterium]|nr:hypothetical protein [Cytophagales bacterium]